MERARLIKRARKAQAAEVRTAERAEAALALVDAVRRTFPGVGAVVGLPAVQGSKLLDARRANALVVLALRPPVRGYEFALVAQKRAVSVVARAALNAQRKFVSESLVASDEGGQPIAPITAVAWQWEAGDVEPTKYL